MRATTVLCCTHCSMGHTRGLRRFLAFLAVCTPVLAQINFATASGSVTDAQSQPLRDAHVEVRSVETGVVRDTHSNDAGLFELPNLPPGDYVLTVTATGFASLSRPIRLEV